MRIQLNATDPVIEMLRRVSYTIGLAALLPICLFFGVWIGFHVLLALYVWFGVDFPTEISVLTLLLPGAFGFWAISRWMLQTWRY